MTRMASQPSAERRRWESSDILRGIAASADNIPLATLFIYVVIVRPPGLPCPVMRVHEIGILSKILSATGGKWIILQKDVPVSNLVSLT